MKFPASVIPCVSFPIRTLLQCSAVRRDGWSFARSRYIVVKFLLGRKHTELPMQETSSVSFSGVFALRDGVREEEFLPRLHAFLQHFIDIGFATDYRVMRREALDGFGKTLPAFTYRGELI